MLKYFLFLVLKPTVTDYAIASERYCFKFFKFKGIKKALTHDRIEVKQAMMFNVQKQFGNCQSCSKL